MAVEFKGTTDEVTTCDHCGRRDLKGTVVLSIDGGEPVYFGVVCAARAIGRPAAEVKAQARSAQDAIDEAKAAVVRAEQQAAMAAWLGFLEANGQGADTFSRIQSLGGYTAARQAFKEAR